MAELTDLDLRVCLDNSTGTLVDLTSYLTSASIRGALDILEDTALNDSERTYLPGKAGATIPLAGMINSTTRPYLEPFIGNRTSVLRTIEYQVYTTSSNSTGNVGYFLYGEVYMTNVELSGSLNSVEMFSADATFSGAVSSTTQSTV